MRLFALPLCCISSVAMGAPIISSTSYSTSPYIAAGFAAVALIALLVVCVSRRRGRRARPSLKEKPTVPVKQAAVIETLADLTIPMQSITELREVGEGQFGRIVEAVVDKLPNSVANDHPHVAVKYLKEEVMATDSILFIDEANRTRNIQHKNVVRLLAVGFSCVPYFIVLEFMENGDLRSYLRLCAPKGTKRGAKLVFTHLLSLTQDVSAGFAYLSSNNFVHRDLAAKNVLLDSNFTAKIGNFGMARNLYNTKYQGQTVVNQWALPLRWMAPESFYDAVWDLQTDVWMFAVLLWEIFSFAALPYSDIADQDVMECVHRGQKLEQPKLCPDDVYDVILGCMRTTRSSRLDPDRALQIINVVLQSLRISIKKRPWPTLSELQNDNRQRSESLPVTESLAKTLELTSDQNVLKVQKLQVARDKIIFQVEEGHGAFGTVFTGTLLTSNGDVSVALKVLRSTEKETVEKYLLEAKLLATMSHPNIIKIIALHLAEPPYVIVMELMSNGPLIKYFKRLGVNSTNVSEHFPGSALTKICQQVAQALKFLASLHICHRDVAARNVLVSASGYKCVKIADLGFARTLASSPYFRKTAHDQLPVKWMAPESILDRVYTTASDVWSFGVFCWEVFTVGDRPYEDLTADKAVQAIFRGHRLSKPHLCPDQIWVMLLRCWQKFPNERIDFASIVTILDVTAARQDSLDTIIEVKEDEPPASLSSLKLEAVHESTI